MSPIAPPANPLDRRTRLWALSEYAAILLSLPQRERDKWLALPVFLVAPGRLEDLVATAADVSKVPTLRRPPSDEAGTLGPSLSRVLAPVAPSRFHAESGHLTVGRSPMCDVVVPLPAVSKVQGYLHDVGPDSAMYEDAGSTNGTFALGARIEPGHRFPLRDGVVMVIGDVRIEFRGATTMRPLILAAGERRSTP